MVIALRPQTLKPNRASWSHYTDTSEPVDGNGALNMVTVQSGFRIRDLSITGPTCIPTALTGSRDSTDSYKTKLETDAAKTMQGHD
jgi:hypothetical protein